MKYFLNKKTRANWIKRLTREAFYYSKQDKRNCQTSDRNRETQREGRQDAGTPDKFCDVTAPKNTKPAWQSLKLLHRAGLFNRSPAAQLEPKAPARFQLVFLNIDFVFVIFSLNLRNRVCWNNSTEFQFLTDELLNFVCNSRIVF